MPEFSTSTIPLNHLGVPPTAHAGLPLADGVADTEANSKHDIWSAFVSLRFSSFRANQL
jgi:hypothetical protein